MNISAFIISPPVDCQSVSRRCCCFPVSAECASGRPLRPVLSQAQEGNLAGCGVGRRKYRFHKRPPTDRPTGDRQTDGPAPCQIPAKHSRGPSSVVRTFVGSTRLKSFVLPTRRSGGIARLLDGQTDGRTDGRTDGLMDGRTDGRADGRTGGRTDGRTDGRAGGRTDGRTDGRTNERKDGRTEERTDGGTCECNVWDGWMDQ